MEKVYNKENIRRLLKASLSEMDVIELCSDHFPTVAEQFSDAMNLRLRFHLLLEHCFRQDEIEKLLTQARKVNPKQYRRFESKLFEDEEQKIANVSGDKAVVEFLTVADVDFNDLTEQQKTGLSIGIRAALASVLGIDAGEIQVLDMRAGSVKITVELPQIVKEKLVSLENGFLESELGIEIPTALRKSVEGRKKTTLSALIIDDEPMARTLLRLMLVRAGFEVIEAQDGLDGFEKAKRELPDLILIDDWMPGIDGFETAKMIKQDEQTAHLQVVLLSTKATFDALKQEIGAVILTKPITSQELTNLAAQLIL